MRGNVYHHVEALAHGLGLGNTQGQVRMVEFIVAHPQAVARLAGIHRIGTVGEGIAHVFQGAGGSQ
ncbi:hypothetical protein D9M69_733270 [compost metagenome]